MSARHLLPDPALGHARQERSTSRAQETIRVCVLTIALRVWGIIRSWLRVRIVTVGFATFAAVIGQFGHLGLARGAVRAGQVLLEDFGIADGVEVGVALGFLGGQTFL